MLSAGPNKIGLLYILGTIIFTVYGQIVLKWRIISYGSLPLITSEKILFILKLFLDPYILSGFLSAFIAALFWMAAMTVYDISFAYPFMSLNFILVLFFGAYFFGDTVSFGKVLGLIMIVSGLVISVKY